MKPATRFGTVLGQVVVKHRKKHGMTQGETAQSLRMPQSSLSRYERGAAPLTVVQLRRAAKIFDVDVSHLFREAEACATSLAKRGVKVVDEEPSEEEKVRLVWMAPRDVEKEVETVTLFEWQSEDFSRAKVKTKEKATVPVFVSRR